MSTTATSINNLFPPQLQKLAPYYVLILVITIFYSNVYDNDFLYDDKYLILQNTYLHNWHSLGDIFRTYVNSGAFRSGHFYRPLQNVLYLIVYQIAGENSFAFHLLNIILHAANACLVYTLGLRLNFKPWAVFLAALIWALHPIHTEAVTYMSSTADTLYSLFCLLGIVVLLPDFTPRKIYIATALSVMSLLSKETAVIFPLLAMSCIYLTSPKRLAPRTYFKTWPLWCVTAGYLIIRFSFLPFSGKDLLNGDPVSQFYATHIFARIYTFLATIPAYLGLLIWPTGLHMDRDFLVRLDPWFAEVCIGLTIILAAMACIVITRKSARPAFSWGLLWFAAAHTPQTGILVAVNSLFLEHWMYLPSVGLILASSQTLALHVPSRYKKMACASACVIALVFGYCTYMQNQIWHDPIVFYKNILDRGETSARARNNLGIDYGDRGDFDKAMEQFQLALQNNDTMPETHQNIAFLYSRKLDGDPHIQEEIDELNKALAIKPDFLAAYDGLAYIYDQKGDKIKASAYRQKADDIRKGFVPQ